MNCRCYKRSIAVIFKIFKVVISVIQWVVSAVCIAIILWGNPQQIDAGIKDKNNDYLIDDFEDGDLVQLSKWWQFGKVQVLLSEQEPSAELGLGKKLMVLKGTSTGWYVGGVGCRIGIDATSYSTLKLLVKGIGKASGTLMIELYDDDNHNEVIEKSKDNIPLYDDKFIYSLHVDWEGFKTVMIPLSRFVDGNYKIGNGIFDPNCLQGSGGLIQMQLILATNKKQGYAQIEIDQIKLTKDVIQNKQEENELYYDEAGF